MKAIKFLSMLLSLFMLISFTTIATISANEEAAVTLGVLGDTDGDNTVTIKDSTLIQKASAILTVLDSNQRLLADVNSDIIVNVKDATSIQKHIAGITVDSMVETQYMVDPANMVGVLSLSINPQFRIEYDTNSAVTHIIADNKEASLILEKLGEYKGLSCEDVINRLITLSYEEGYITEYSDGNNQVVILRVKSGSMVPDDRFMNKLGESADHTADTLNIKPKFVGIDNRDYDNKYDKGTLSSPYITLEKAIEIALGYCGVWEQDATFTEKEYDLDDGTPYYELEFYTDDFKYECNVSALTGKVRSFEKEANAARVPVEDYITLAKAKEIALIHAGVSPEEAVFDNRDFDLDDGTPYYELEFYAGSYEYEYDIHGISGDIINYERDRADDDDYYYPPAPKPTAPEATVPKPTVPNPTDPKPTTPKPNTPETPSDIINLDRAKEFALAHAGVSPENAVFTGNDFDRDDRTPCYELEFYAGGFEYEYEIHAVTGKVLDFDREPIDD